MHIAAFTLARLARQTRDKRPVLTGGERLKRAFKRRRIAELMHARCATAQLARRLRAAQQQGRDQRDFGRREFQIAKFRITKALLIFGHAIAETADGAQIMAFHQLIQRLLHLRLAQVHHRLAVGFLIAGRHHAVDRERILLRRGDLFFQHTADDARFQRAELMFHDFLLSAPASIRAR